MKQEEHDEATAVLSGAGESTVMSRREPEAPSASGELQPEQIGRYRIVGRLGAGGMASVWLGVDPQLGREVAIKRVQAPDPKMRALFLREAQALAAMSHPNVVTIYEVGDHEGVPFLAMERISGVTLRLWLEAKHSIEEILEVMRQAGRGLAAAHAQSLVHRDFKPANVLVGTDGRVRVVDFGLARPVDPQQRLRSTEDGEDLLPSAMAPSSGELTLSAPGMVMGTPPYMSPEQLAGHAVGAACDQYAFCTTLYEALYGRRPFTQRTLRALADAKNRGVDPQPPRSDVPRSVHAAILRGLAPDPEQRWPSMERLLAALEHNPKQRWWRWGAVVVMGGAVVGVSVPLWSNRAEPCSGSEAHLVDAWGPKRRGRAEASILGTDLPYAAKAWAHIESTIDAYAAEWVEQHRGACEATTVRGEQSTEVMDLRMGCLQRARVQLSAITDLFVEADTQVVDKAHQIVEGLVDLDRCADIEALRAAVPPPPKEQAAAVDEVRRRLAQARALSKAGKHGQAIEIVDDAAHTVETLAYPPLMTELVALRGRFRSALGPYDEAEAILEDALMRALRWGQWRLAVDAAIDLAFLVGYHQLRPDGGLAYAKIGRGLLARAGDDARLEADLRNATAAIYQVQGRHEEAEAEFRTALELRESVLGPKHPDVAKARDNLGLALHHMGRVEEAEVENRAALQLLTEALGVAHPAVAQSRNNLAVTLSNRGRFEEAELHFRKVLETMRSALGDEHAQTAAAQHNLGAVLRAQQRWAEAEVEYRAALAKREAVLAADHPDLAESRFALAMVLIAQDRSAEALAPLRRAWEVFQRDATPAGRRGEIAFELAKLLWNLDEDRTRARRLAEQAIEALREAGEDQSDRRAAVEAWLQRRQ